MDIAKDVIATLIAAACLYWLPARQWKAMTRQVRLLRRDMRRRDGWTRNMLRRMRRTLAEHAQRHQAHDARFEQLEQRLAPTEEAA